jgi:hypothetical protein
MNASTQRSGATGVRRTSEIPLMRAGEFTQPMLTDHGTVLSHTRGSNGESSFESMNPPKAKYDPFEGDTNTLSETPNSIVE